MLNFVSLAPLPFTIGAQSRSPTRVSACASANASASSNFKRNLASLTQQSGNVLELLAFRNLGIRAPDMDRELSNVDGKRASFQIYASIAAQHDGVIDQDAAKSALELYAELCDEAAGNPGAHPNIDFLMDVARGDLNTKFVCRIDGIYVSGKSS